MNRGIRHLILALLVSAISFSQQVGVQVAKDPTAIAVAQKALLAMGGASLAAYQDSYAAGSVTIYGDTGSQSFPAVLRSKGLREFRYEIQKSQGTDIYVTDGIGACITWAKGTFQLGSVISLFGQRIDHIPAFSLLAEYANSNLSVQYAGTASVNGKMADVISLSVDATPPNGFTSGKVGERLVFVDQATGLVTKMQGYLFNDTNPNDTNTIELYFLNYQSVGGIAVPFTRLVVTDGQNTSLLTLTSVTLNTGLTDTLFNPSCGVQNAQ